MSYEQEQFSSNKILTILLSWQKHMQNNDVLKNTNIDLKLVMRVHGIISILMGFITFILPHSVYTSSEGNYNHMAHEYVRLYGCLTLTIGYFVYATQDIKDGRLRKSVTKSFTPIKKDLIQQTLTSVFGDGSKAQTITEQIINSRKIVEKVALKRTRNRILSQDN